MLLRDASALAIVDPAERGRKIGRVATGRDPHEVTASTDGRLAFVASMVDGISVIDLAGPGRNPAGGSGTGQPDPRRALYHQDKVYFTIEGYKSIGRYDPATDADRLDARVSARRGRT